jgi:hypothetical protein
VTKLQLSFATAQTSDSFNPSLDRKGNSLAITMFVVIEVSVSCEEIFN